MCKILVFRSEFKVIVFRIHPSKDWIQSKIPEIVKNGVKGLRDDTMGIDEMDAETFVQAYVNIIAGACISLGMVFLQIHILFAMFSLAYSQSYHTLPGKETILNPSGVCRERAAWGLGFNSWKLRFAWHWLPVYCVV